MREFGRESEGFTRTTRLPPRRAKAWHVDTAGSETVQDAHLSWCQTRTATLDVRIGQESP